VEIVIEGRGPAERDVRNAQQKKCHVQRDKLEECGGLPLASNTQELKESKEGNKN